MHRAALLLGALPARRNVVMSSAPHCGSNLGPAAERRRVCTCCSHGCGPRVGSSYALAKRLQHWRAMLAREAGCLVSSNVAPSTRTASVTQNKNFAHAYRTMHLFRPYEVA